MSAEVATAMSVDAAEAVAPAPGLQPESSPASPSADVQKTAGAEPEATGVVSGAAAADSEPAGGAGAMPGERECRLAAMCTARFR